VLRGRIVRGVVTLGAARAARACAQQALPC
jgi:hypothetical protein